jgi:DNA modification methylase
MNTITTITRLFFTTGVACKNTGRNYILIEKEPEYIDIINKRLENTSNNPPLITT